jgi:hypothetical protein
VLVTPYLTLRPVYPITLASRSRQLRQSPLSGKALTDHDELMAGRLGAARTHFRERHPLPIVLGMSPKDAIAAHVNWKLRIHALLSGKLSEKLDPGTIARDNVCELGKWIYGEGKEQMSGDTHSDLMAAHASFHKEAARIVKEFYAGQKIGLEAIEMNAPFGKLTTRVVGILSRLGQR